ncbi:MAG: hypothetical protein WDZ68_00915 [Candidatus Paceibacterota bacterium]
MSLFEALLFDETEQHGCLCAGRNYDDLMDYHESEQEELNLLFWLQNASEQILFESFVIVLKRYLPIG